MTRGLAAMLGGGLLVLATNLGTAQTAGVPPLMLPYGSGWSGGIGPGGRAARTATPPETFLPDDYLNGPQHRQAALERGVAREKVTAYLQVRTTNQFIAPEHGIGPISDDPGQPFFNNGMALALGKDSTFPVAGLNDEAGRNLKPWAASALRKHNALVLSGRNVGARRERCWELGVPGIHEVPQPLYFIQTPDEVVMYLGHRVRHVYMNVPHSTHLTPSWYGESIGHYEDDALVVDTIGQNDKTFVDVYRTPHTAAIHVIERFRVTHGGKGLETSFTVEDPGAFYRPWGARRPRFLLDNRPLNDMDAICAAGNEDRFNLGLDPLPQAHTPDF